MKARREANILKAKAIASLKWAAVAFNGHEEEGRTTRVMCSLQHAFEMLLKAALVQRRQVVFDKRLGQSIGFERCVNLSRQHLGMTDEQAGTLRAIDALHDEEQHWFMHLDEGLLYAHARAALTLFDDLLQQVFEERLIDHLPHRVLPISAEPPRDIQILVDEEYSQIEQLLAPGRRRRPEARARIRSLLAMEAHVADNVIVSKKDVDRVEKAIRQGKNRAEVFPRLEELGTDVAGEGVTVTVRFVKRGGLPVRYVGSDDPGAAAAVREVDLQLKYHRTASNLAQTLGLTPPRATALRRALEIDEDPSCVHDFPFGKMTHRMYSDNTFTKMRDALERLDMDDVWRQYRPRRRAVTNP